MLYIERQPSKRSVALLVMLGGVLYLGALWFLELRASDEALHAAIAREMTVSGNYLKTHLYGHPIKEYPLYNWLVALLSGFQSPNLLSLRLPSILSVWGLALLCGLAARRLQSHLAGFIAAAVVLLCVASLQIGIRAQTEFLQALLLCSAWWTWYYFGLECKRWNCAWGWALALVFAGILNGGLKMAFWFYLPLFFMPRQVNARMRMQMPSHIVSALVLALFICIWQWITPNQPLLPWNQELGLKLTSANHSGYFWHLIVFPCKVMYYLAPWSLLLWAPFCIALRQFERQPVACRYFRVIIFTVFLAVWLWPSTSPLALLPVLGPVAILIGVHFEIVLRRYQQYLSLLVHVTSWLVLACSVIMSVFWLLVGSGIIAIQDLDPYRPWLYLILLSIGEALLWMLILRKNSRCTFRASLVWCIAATFLLVLCSSRAYINWRMSTRRIAGETLAGKDQTNGYAGICDITENISHIYYRPMPKAPYLYFTEFYYLNCPIKLVRPREDLAKVLPETERVVYVLSSHTPPVPSRSWRLISPPVTMHRERVLNDRKIMLSCNSGQEKRWQRPWLTIELAAPQTTANDQGKKGTKDVGAAHSATRDTQTLQLFEGTLQK